MSEIGFRGKKDFLSIDDHSLDEVNFILDCAEFFIPFSGAYYPPEKPLDMCKGRTAVIMSFEPTTRTGSSSQAAMQRLGGNAVVIQKEGSAMDKGEPAIDTIRNIHFYGDILGIRGPNVRDYAQWSIKSLINLGDDKEHPSQALQNALLFRRCFGRLHDLTIVYLNDLIYGRVMPSEMKLLRKERGNKFYGTPLPNCGMELPDELDGDDYEEIRIEDIPECKPHVVHVIRPQLNRMSEKQKELYKQNPQSCYLVDEDFMKRLPKETIVIHDQPNTGEISKSVYGHPQLKMDEQSALGVPTRMSVFSLWLGYEDKIRELMQRAKYFSSAQA
jgi:aspartate carbamoyltransferase catalytic subunit